MIEFFINPDRRQFFPSWSITDESMVKMATVNPRLHAQAPKLIQDLRDNLPFLLLNDTRGLDITVHCAIAASLTRMILFVTLNNITPQNVSNVKHSSNAWGSIFWLISGTHSPAMHAMKIATPTMWLTTPFGMLSVTNVGFC